MRKVNFFLILELNLFAIVSGKTLYIYKYDHKKMNIIPPIFDQVTLEKEPKFLQITRDSTISVLYEEKLDIFIVTDTKVRKKFSKKYEFPSGM